MDEMAQIKRNLTRSGRPTTSAYAAGGGRGGGRGGGVDFEPLPSASGPVAPELFLEGGPSRDAITHLSNHFPF